MNCGTCANWRLTGPLAKHDYGQCAVQPNPLFRAGGYSTSSQCICRIGRYVPIKPEKKT